MKSVGMDNVFLDKALRALDSPKAQKLSFMANMLGININELKQNINSLKTSNNNYNYTRTDDPLEGLKSGLQRHK